MLKNRRDFENKLENSKIHRIPTKQSRKPWKNRHFSEISNEEKKPHVNPKNLEKYSLILIVVAALVRVLAWIWIHLVSLLLALLTVAKLGNYNSR
jgi:hypothetical protein